MSDDTWMVEQALRQIDLDQAQIELYATAPPKEHFFKGFVQSTLEARSPNTAAVDKALDGLRQKAKDKGANGVIGVRVEHSHSDTLQTFFVTAYGDAVLFGSA